MLASLYKIGEQLSSEVGEFYSIIDYPKVDEIKKNYVLEIIFDLDKKEIIIDNSGLREYNPSQHPIDLWNLKILGRRNKAIYICTRFEKIQQLKKSLFASNGSEGEFIEHLNKKFPKFRGRIFYKALEEINKLKNQSILFSKAAVRKKLNLPKNTNLVLCYISIKSNTLDIVEPTKISDLDGYIDFIREKFRVDIDQESKITLKKLCYSTGELENDVEQADFPYVDLNKVFVKTYKNYANDFDENNFYKNYQISLDAKNKFILAAKDIQQNLKVQIAGVNNFIIPHFPNYLGINIEWANKKLKKRTDLLFNLNKLEDFKIDIDDEFEDNIPIYWLNFYAYDTDGKSLKVVNQIKDVNKFHFEKILASFQKSQIEMNEYLDDAHNFNFYSIYKIVPIRYKRDTKTKRMIPAEKKNIVLSTLGDILEQRKIHSEILFDCFAELILCHKYKRNKDYKNYLNVKYFDNFDFAIKDAVFKYLLVFNILRNLGQLSNHNFLEATMNNEETNNKENFSAKIEDFFIKMNYSDSQKAMFFLGRMLNTIAYKQYSSGHKQKPILQKINYNGMDKDNIQRLRLDLFEKGKQYNIVNKIELDDGRFTNYFNFNEWNLKPKEALFFVLSGYSFGLAVLNQDAENLNEMEETDNE